MFHSKHTKPNLYSLNPINPWILCRFLKFPKNADPLFTILWNWLHERCFKLYTSFRLETGWTRNVSFSFRFVAASRKKLLYISIKSHNVEVKLCNVYHFLKRLMVLQVEKYFSHLSCSISLQWIAFRWCSFCTNSKSFGIGQTVYFSFINRNVSLKPILLI